MNCIRLFPRRLYLVLLSIILSAIYPLRWFVLFRFDEHHTSFVTHFLNVRADESKIVWYPLLIFLFILFSFAFFIPRQTTVILKEKYKSFINMMILTAILLKIAQILLGIRYGKEGIGIGRLFAFLDGLIPLNFFLIIVFIFFNNPEKMIVLLCYIVLTTLSASKAGILHAVLSLYCVNILKGGRIINRKFIILVSLIIVSFPILYYIVAGMRRDSFSFNNMVEGGLKDFLGKENIIKYALILLSRRITAIDILLVPKIEGNITFSFLSTLTSFLTGLFPSSFIYILFPKITNGRLIGQGRLFAEEFFGQEKIVVNSFESSLYGLIYFSDNKISIIVLLLLLIIGSFLLFFLYKKKWIISLLMVYFIQNFCVVIMTGNMAAIGVIFRQAFAFIFFINIYNGMRRNGFLARGNIYYK